jgi:phosphotransferase system HPr (HPr) family protein
MENHPLHRRKVVVALQNGLHVRPMSLIAQATGRFAGEVFIRREDGYAVNAKSMFDLLTLRAEHGMPLMLEAQGEGAVELLDQLESMFDNNFGWDDEEDEYVQDSEPPLPTRQNSRPQAVKPEQRLG